MGAVLYKQPPRAQDLTGKLRPGASLEFYASGGLTPRPVYADTGFEQYVGNPLRSDSAARFPNFWFPPFVPYRVRLTDAGAVLWDLDPFLVFPGSDTGIPLDNAGAPLPFAVLTFWADQTTELQPIYTSSALTVERANPITADANGLFPAIYLDDSKQTRARMNDRNGALVYDVSQGVPRAACDVDYGQLVLLLHMDGTNGSTAFVDSSSYAHPMSVTGDTHITTSGPKFGSGALTQTGGGSGTTNTLQTPMAPELDWANQVFTFECYVLNGNVTGTGTLVACRDFGSSSGLFVAINKISKDISVTIFGDASFTTNIPGMQYGVYYHVAVVSDGVRLKLFVDGVQVNSGVLTGGATAFTFPLQIGSDCFGFAWDGKIDEVRAYKNVAKYSANFTPGGPFPSIAC